jgi:spoIIIJ-associated protein
MNDTIKDILGQLLTLSNLPFTEITVREADAMMIADITSEKPSYIIGRHGETLNALQEIIKSMVRSKEGLERSPFIVIDVDGYRKDQDEKIKHMAESRALKVRKWGHAVAMPPMNPYARRVAHLHIANSGNFDDLTTYSEGEGRNRHLVIAPDGDGELTVELDPEPAVNLEEGFENLDI